MTQAVPGGTNSPTGEDQVAEVLIRLSRDEVTEIRGHATFGLGSILSIDNTDVLFASGRFIEDVQDEAIVGLPSAAIGE